MGIISADLVEDKIYFMIWERLLNSQLLIFFAQCKINKNQSFLTSNVIGIDIYIHMLWQKEGSANDGKKCETLHVLIHVMLQ